MPGLFATHDLPSSYHRGHSFPGRCRADPSFEGARAREETDLVPDIIQRILDCLIHPAAVSAGLSSACVRRVCRSSQG